MMNKRNRREEDDKAAVIEALDRIAEQCRRDGSPLLTVLTCRWTDGSVDLEAIRRHWVMRYARPLPADDQQALARIQQEVRACHIWSVQHNKGKEEHA